MATITYSPGNGAYAPPTATYDITSVTAERMGSAIYYYAFDSDGTMFVLHTQNVTQADGSVVNTITGWDQFSGSTLLQSASCNLPAQPFLDNLASRNPSSTQAMNYFLSGDDALIGSSAKDNMVSLGGNDTLTGNGGADKMQAGAGNDVLTGGAGADQLAGGSGADQFVFLKTSEGGDKISDFHSGEDHIALSASAFHLSGPISEGHGFVTGTAATGPGATLIWDAAHGLLSFDADGAGGAAALTLATLTGGASLTAADILLL
jgi:Ca2+-binding RTX toxin-like protein